MAHVLKELIETVHEGERPFSCNTSSKKYRSKSTLKQHVASVHEKKKTKICVYCGKGFFNLNNMKRHEFTKKSFTIQVSYFILDLKEPFKI